MIEYSDNQQLIFEEINTINIKTSQAWALLQIILRML
jgi:hypothetical protein